MGSQRAARSLTAKLATRFPKSKNRWEHQLVMEIIKSINLLLRFLLELGLLVAFGYWGFTTGELMIVKIGLGIGAPLLFAVIWGLFLAPKASRRLHEPWRLILELVIFGLAIAALYGAGQPAWAWAFGLIYAINKT